MNRNTRRKANQIRKASKSDQSSAQSTFGTHVPFGRNVNSSEARKEAGRKPWKGVS